MMTIFLVFHGTLFFFFQKLPSHAVNIRAIETVRYSVIDQKKNDVLEEIEESKAFFQVLTSTYVDKGLRYLSRFIKCICSFILYLMQVYEGAVYLRQGKTYLVEKLDLSSKTAFCKEADLKYYTKTRDYTDIHVIGGNIVCDLQFGRDPLHYLSNLFLLQYMKTNFYLTGSFMK
jgi:DEAD/DEAH box helicase domain-containing protein